jgi:hypothetical protein
MVVIYIVWLVHQGIEPGSRRGYTTREPTPSRPHRSCTRTPIDRVSRWIVLLIARDIRSFEQQQTPCRERVSDGLTRTEPRNTVAQQEQRPVSDHNVVRKIYMRTFNPLVIVLCLLAFPNAVVVVEYKQRRRRRRERKRKVTQPPARNTFEPRSLSQHSRSLRVARPHSTTRRRGSSHHLPRPASIGLAGAKPLSTGVDQ